MTDGELVERIIKDWALFPDGCVREIVREFAQAVAEKIKRNRTELECPCETCKAFEEFNRLLLREAGIEKGE